MVLELALRILVPLSRKNEVVLEQKYCNVPRLDGLRSAYLGMGSLQTWHGTPDVRVRGAEVVLCCAEASKEEDVYAPASTEDPYDGSATNVEGKIVLHARHLPQLVTTCVVAAFTEKNCCPSLPGVVPTILLDHKQFVCTIVRVIAWYFPTPYC